jgi:ribose transport system ATP-binding protein
MSTETDTAAFGDVDPEVPTLKLTGVHKQFGRVTACNNISMEIARNEVVGLIGENGAGKSSLLKILTGIYQPDRGTIEINGNKVDFRRPQDAAAAGIGVVHQEQSLFTNLSVAENIAMNGVQSKDSGIRYGFYRWGTLNREAEEVLAKVHAKVDPKAIVGDLSFVERQMVEIARALRVDEMVHASPLVILDEPTSVLERDETEILEREIRDLKKIGSVIFVSHRLDEVLRICDRVVVMRSGEIVAERNTADVDEDELFRLMIGRNERAEIHPKDRAAETVEPVLQAEGLGRTHAFKGVDISLVPGRTVAIVGTNGSGRESVCRALFGAETFDEGTLRVDGKPVRGWTMRQAVKSGIAYVPAERRVEGMVGGMDAAENLTLIHPGPSRRGPFLRRGARKKIAAEWFEKLDVRPRDPALDLARFSGGNQQKVVMAKWLQSENTRALILDHPLRGLDPGASETLNDQIRAATENGAAVLLLADTLEEALHMGDEILVMRDGEVTARFDLAVEAPTAIDLLEKMV